MVIRVQLVAMESALDLAEGDAQEIAKANVGIIVLTDVVPPVAMFVQKIVLYNVSTVANMFVEADAKILVEQSAVETVRLLVLESAWTHVEMVAKVFAKTAVTVVAEIVVKVVVKIVVKGGVVMYALDSVLVPVEEVVEVVVNVHVKMIVGNLVIL